MSRVIFTEAGLDRRCRVTGRAMEDVEAAVVCRDGDRVTLDDTHPSYPSLRGLGDVIATATDYLGIQPCGGCKERQAWINGTGT